MIRKTFVGRGDELSRIRGFLQRPSGGLILINGNGGIGKTSLLRKIEKEYSVDDGYIIDYFDLSEQPMEIINQAIHTRDTLVKNLRGHADFSKFNQKLVEIEGNLELGISDLKFQAVRSFVEDVALCLEKEQKRLLRITDTYEIAAKYHEYDDDWFLGINKKLKDIPNSVFIFAGRDYIDDRYIFDNVYQKAMSTFGEKNVLHLPLKPFNNNESEDFFKENDRHHVIPQDMRKKLMLLTRGRPILLSLAVEWLQKDIPLPEMTEKDFLELEKTASVEGPQGELFGSFEFELVSKVRQFRSPLDTAILYMAHINRRMDGKLLSVLLDVDEDTSGKIINILINEMPFVKEFIGSEPRKCVLHDEMQRLVVKHAWESLDISGEERRRLTRKVLKEYYEPQINLHKQKNIQRENEETLLRSAEGEADYWNRWLLERESLYYHFQFGKAEGYRYLFNDLYYSADTDVVRGEILIDEVKRSGYYDENILLLLNADNLLRKGKNEVAREICLGFLEKGNIDVVDRAHVYTTLGNIDIQQNPESARKSYNIALDLAKTLEDSRLQYILHNNLGRVQKNTGQIDEAITHFSQALTFVHKLERSGASATIRNNLAATLRIKGYLDEADNFCSLSITENRKYGRERPLAYSYLTKADVDREKGDFQSAERYARLAFSIFDRLEDDEGKSQAYRTLANISRYLRQFEQALRYLRSAILLVENRSYFSLLASLYQLYGRTYRHYANHRKEEEKNTDTDQNPEISNLYSEALQALQLSIVLAQKIGNRWEVARSKIEIVLIMMLKEEILDEGKVYDLLEQVWQTAEELNDHLLKGYVYENRARVSMNHKNYLEAGHAFGEAAYLFAKRTGLEMERSFRRLNEILLDPNLSDSYSKMLAQGVYERIQKEGYKEFPKLVALKNMCHQILDIQDVEDTA